MRLVRLFEFYDRKDLVPFPGDQVLRREAFRPYFENLHENKLIYHERFIALIELEELNLSDQTFEGFARLLKPIRPLPNMIELPERWRFCNAWKNCCLGRSGHCLSNPYVGFRIWPEAELVQEVEQLLEGGDLDAANALLR